MRDLNWRSSSQIQMNIHIRWISFIGKIKFHKNLEIFQSQRKMKWWWWWKKNKGNGSNEYTFRPISYGIERIIPRILRLFGKGETSILPRSAMRWSGGGGHHLPPSGSVTGRRGDPGSHRGIRSPTLGSLTSCDDRHGCSRWRSLRRVPAAAALRPPLAPEGAACGGGGRSSALAALWSRGLQTVWHPPFAPPLPRSSSLPLSLRNVVEVISRNVTVKCRNKTTHNACNDALFGTRAWRHLYLSVWWMKFLDGTEFISFYFCQHIWNFPSGLV